MKVMLEQKDLAKLVTTVSRAAATNSVVPALSGMMLEVGGGKLIATCLDLAIGIRVATPEVQAETDGRVLVNAHHFTDLVKKLPGGIITLELVNNKLRVKYGRNKADINTLMLADWTDWPDKGYIEKFSLPQDKLRIAFQNTLFATAKNHFRQVFTGVLIDVQPAENEIRFVGTDTHRMAYYRIAADNLPEDWKPVIPAQAVNELTRVLQGEELCSVGVNGNNIIFCWENFEMFSRLIEGQFPNYLQVIPGNTVSSIDFDTAAVRSCVERINMLPVSDKTQVARLSLELKEELALSGSSDLVGEINETCGVTGKVGEDIAISFNATYFLEALKVMPETAKLSFSGAMSASIMQAAPEYLIVLVPLRVA